MIPAVLNCTNLKLKKQQRCSQHRCSVCSCSSCLKCPFSQGLQRCKLTTCRVLLNVTPCTQNAALSTSMEQLMDKLHKAESELLVRTEGTVAAALHLQHARALNRVCCCSCLAWQHACYCCRANKQRATAATAAAAAAVSAAA